MEYRRCVIIGASPDTDIAVLKREISSDDFPTPVFPVNADIFPFKSPFISSERL